MDSDELPDLEEKSQIPKSEQVLIIPDDSTTTASESGNSSFKPTTARSNTLSTGTATTNATVDYYPVV